MRWHVNMSMQYLIGSDFCAARRLCARPGITSREWQTIFAFVCVLEMRMSTAPEMRTDACTILADYCSSLRRFPARAKRKKKGKTFARQFIFAANQFFFIFCFCRFFRPLPLDVNPEVAEGKFYLFISLLCVIFFSNRFVTLWALNNKVSVIDTGYTKYPLDPSGRQTGPHRSVNRNKCERETNYEFPSIGFKNAD